MLAFSNKGWGQTQISEGFESGLPTSYSIGSYTLGSGTWVLTDVIRGTSGLHAGTYSCQLHSATGSNIISPNIASGGVSTVTFWASRTTGSGSALQVNYSTDGGSTWSAATGSPFSLTTSVTQYTATINNSSPNIIVQFYRTAATINIDDIDIEAVPVTSACGLQGFDAGTTPPAGWTFTSIGGTYTTAGNYGTSSPSLQMDATGDAITTANVSNPYTLSFWIKGEGSITGSSLLVEGYNGSSWSTIANITTLPTTGTIYGYSNISSYTQFRFTYIKSAGNLAFDDVNINCTTPSPLTGVYLVDEEFTASQTDHDIPATTRGFSCTSDWISNSTAIFNRNPNSLVFTANGTLTTPIFAGGDLLSFWMQNSSGTASGTLEIQTTTDGTTWITLATETNISNFPRSYIYAISTSVIQVRFNYTKVSGNIDFDDVTIRKSGMCTGTRPLVERILVNSCNNTLEGRNELVEIKTGSTDINVNDLMITFPSVDGTAGTSFSGSGCTKKFTTNSTYTAALNTLATTNYGSSCTVAVEPPGGIIPANSNLVIFTGTTPEFTYDFSSDCGNTVYVVYCNNSETSGRFSNQPNAGDTRYFSIVDKATACYDQVYYDHSIADVDGEQALYNLSTRALSYGNFGCTDILPIVLLSFQAKCVNSNVKLSWSTASETNNNFFTIEQSIDAGNWKILATIPGAGNSNTTLAYSYNDNDPLAGTSYYRLMQTDYNGKSEIFNPVSVNCNSNNEISFDIVNIRNNEMNNGLSVTYTTSNNGENVTAGLYNIIGQQLVQQKQISSAGGNTIEFYINNLDKGVYLVKLDNSENVIIKKIVIP